MKFTFKIQQYQTNAVESIVKCFEGQQFADKITYLRDKGIRPKIPSANQELFETEDADFGYANAPLALSDRYLLSNIHKIQDQNFIVHSAKIEETAGHPSFDIEMETGTGKTYVYTKTMYELNTYKAPACQ